MTCQEFHDFTDRHPLSLTRAERSAVVNHRDSCPACEAWLKAESEAWEAQRSPLQAIVDLAECVFIRSIIASDKQDPEVAR